MTESSLAALDPDDPRPPYVQVASIVRAAILTGRIAPGERLPSQAQLSQRYGVARMTIQQSLRQLKDEGLIVSRQGSGVFARQRTARPIGLRPHIEAAFAQETVSIDVSGYTAETMAAAMQEPLDKIRDGRLTPQSIQLRLLLSDMAAPMAIPSRAGDDPGDDARVRNRMAKTTERYAGGLVENLGELRDLGLVERSSVEIRVHSSAPLFKLYLINHAELFFGFYPVVQHEVTIGPDRIAIFDPMGKDAQLFHHSLDSDPDSLGSLYVAEAEKWFNSIWGTIARPWHP